MLGVASSDWSWVRQSMDRKATLPRPGHHGHLQKTKADAIISTQAQHKQEIHSPGIHELMVSQRAKKVVSDSPGLVDFAIGLVNSVFNLPDGQVIFF